LHQHSTRGPAHRAQRAGAIYDPRGSYRAGFLNGIDPHLLKLLFASLLLFD